MLEFAADFGGAVAAGVSASDSVRNTAASHTVDQSSAEGHLVTLLFRYLPDVSDATLSEVAEILVELVQDAALTEDTRKRSIEQVLGPLGASEYDDLRFVAVKVGMDRETQRDADPDLIGGGGEDEAQGFADDGLNFVDLNEPIRFRDRTVVRPQDITAPWLKRKLTDSGTTASVDDILAILQMAEAREQMLLEVLGVENVGLVELLNKNSEVVYWYHKLANAATGDEREEILSEISVRNIRIEDLQQHNDFDEDLPNIIDLGRVARLALPESANQKVELPDGSTRISTPLYDQYDLSAASRSLNSASLFSIDQLPNYMHNSFKSIQTFNAVQSRVVSAVLETTDNILVCAPTGAGKTNMALLAILKCLRARMRAVYIAPMKALVQELVQTLQARLQDVQGTSYKVQEVSGDEALSRHELILADVLIATPEKWDVVTSKPANYDYLQSIGLLVVDEIHLLNDDTRGGVLETVVMRHKRMLKPARILALSATLPNYTEVAQFIRAPESSTFFFDASLRPVPLKQTFIAIRSPKLSQQRRENNDVLVEKVLEALAARKQVLVFVQSRKGTELTRQLILDGADLSETQIAVHHAGLTKPERGAVETGFREGAIRVLVCTSTLAWGVNLPASVVIIKDTQYYDPASEGWRQLKHQDVVQILGRAGRPGFDVEGHGIILTTQKHLPYFASIATTAFPAQSYLMNRVTSAINAEVVLCTIRSLDEAVDWLKQSFWYIRAASDADVYGRDSAKDIAHSVLTELAHCGAVKYEYPVVSPAYRGYLASNFYIAPRSIAIYTTQLKPWLTEIDLIRVFSRSFEYSKIFVRRGESAELSRLADLCPIPVRDDLSSGMAKVCVLLQAYISRLNLTGLALAADMVYIAQNASRLFRALFELSLSLRWAKVARIAHQMYMSVHLRLWQAGQSAFRQFKDCPQALIKKAERSLIPFERLLPLTAPELAKVLHLEDNLSLATAAHHYMSMIPRFEITAIARPLARQILELELEFTSMFEVSDNEQFVLLVEAYDGQVLNMSKLFTTDLCSAKAKKSRRVPISLESPYPAVLFVRLLSDKWLHAQSELAVDLRGLEPPARSSQGMEIEVQESMEIDNVNDLVDMGSKFGLIQRAILPLLHGSSRNALICIPTCCDFSRALRMALREKTVVIMQSVDRERRLTPDVVFLTVNDVERISRRQSDVFETFGDINTIICCDLHTLAGDDGYKYELAMSRLRPLVHARIVGFAYPTGSALSLAKWLGVSKHDVGNFPIVPGVSGPSIEVRPNCDSYLVSFLGLALDATQSALLVAPGLRELSGLRDDLRCRGYNHLTVVSGEADLSMAKLYDVTVICDAERLLDVSPFNRIFALASAARESAFVFAGDCDLLATALSEPLPLESRLVSVIADAFVPGIVDGSIRSPQDAVNWIASTFLYQRLVSNPGYYGSRDLQDWISEAIESAFEYLALHNIVSMDPGSLEVSPRLAAHILTKHGGWIQDLVAPVDVSRVLSTERSAADRFAFARTMDSRIDLAFGNNDLVSLLNAVDQRQAIVQNLDLGTSPLMQIPHLTVEALDRFRGAEINSVQDFVSIEDDELRNQLLGFGADDPRMADVADFANSYPIVDIVSASSEGPEFKIEIERDIYDDDECRVVAPGYHGTDGEQWYVVVSDVEKNVLGMQRVVIDRARLLLTFRGLSAASSVWLLCDSYVDADKEYTV